LLVLEDSERGARSLAAAGSVRERRAMLAFSYSAAIAGVDAYVVRAESVAAAGTPELTLAGLPDRSGLR